MNKHKSNNNGLVVLVAGGTAGHINAAIALEKKFLENNFDVLFFSGKRPLDFKLFANKSVIHLDARPIKYKNPLKIIWSLYKNIVAFIKVLMTMYRLRPLLAIGAGGYICGPVLMAHYLLRIPFFIIEQNAVLGVTNKILLLFANKIFIHLKHTIGIPKFFNKKVIVSGNPIRSEFLTTNFNVCRRDKDNREDEFAIVVFGGSLGATPINDLIEAFVSSLQKNYDLNFKLRIKHQTGKRDISSFPKRVENKDIIYQQLEYLDDICKEYCDHDFIICRSGASTISELRYVRKPVILIPYPHHKDRHQFINAESLKHEAEDANSHSCFNVYIEDVVRLAENNFTLLKNIIRSNYSQRSQRSQCSNQNSQQSGLLLEMKDATEIIYNISTYSVFNK
ncbi:MAG: UDP-N-acetylglucosamine--N-acetylmuramyl-(pentapeptide) pyrophosphoryl-undecaprenol N-acetylglucosamine transferase [Oligoflexia bacterium]|nr:UDP-N-acetylglucosamine--N-acetylmuramyl-(pentapeptide) pyrophosphoryl-undecaprenol N-acetylglucosamine transferase [Oligoflexia bacterium]